ncbi:hypothetical protein [Streptomyces sp. NPDC002132]|uniref:hypothetical protein n=1 Tax=unclassified Streptomyces TaxID=2593676 RepID=UPI003326B5B8
MYSKTHSQPFTRTYYSEICSDSRDGRDAPAPQAPAWLLAGEDDENVSDHPHICRGID